MGHSCEQCEESYNLAKTTQLTVVKSTQPMMVSWILSLDLQKNTTMLLVTMDWVRSFVEANDS